MKKYLAVILLFIGLAVAPSINANVDESETRLFSKIDEGKTVKLAVCEYKADGTIEKNIVRLSRDKFNELKAEVQTVRNTEERLSIFKDYNLIPRDVTLEKLRGGMEEKAQGLDLTKEKLEKNTRWLSSHNNNRKFYMNRKCIVSSIVSGIKLNFGSSFITSVINAYLYWHQDAYHGYFTPFPSIDFLKMFFWGFLSLDVSNGLLSDIYIESGGNSIMIMLGFVGYHISGLPTLFLEPLGMIIGYTIFFGISYKE